MPHGTKRLRRARYGFSHADQNRPEIWRALLEEDALNRAAEQLADQARRIVAQAEYAEDQHASKARRKRTRGRVSGEVLNLLEAMGMPNGWMRTAQGWKDARALTRAIGIKLI